MEEHPSLSVPADDRGLAYGDGLFETMAVVRGQVRLLECHLDRLCGDAQRLGIPADRKALESAITDRGEALQSGVLKLLLTRGSGARGYAPPREAVPRLLFLPTPRPRGFADGWRKAPSDEVRVRVCQTPLSINPMLGGMKHLNRLPQVLARGEWNDTQIHEGLMRAAGEGVVCATAANVFALTGDTLMTPSLKDAGVAGVMRRALLEVAGEEGLSVSYQDLDLDLLRHRSDAMLLSSSLTGLRRVTRIDGDGLPECSARAHGLLDRLRSALGKRLGNP